MRSLSLVLFALVALLALFVAQPVAGATNVDCTISEFKFLANNGMYNVWTGAIPDLSHVKIVDLANTLPYSNVKIHLTMEDLSSAFGFVETYYGTAPGTLLSNVSQQVVAANPANATFLTDCNLQNIITVHSYYRIVIPGTQYTNESVLSCDYNYVVVIRNKECGVHGDPQFSGLRGQSFQVHGIDGAVYSLISAPTYLVNSRFDFLNGPRACPVMPTTGRKSIACWSHPGSYLGAVSVRTVAGDVLLIESGSASTGFSSVTLNDRVMTVSDIASLASSMGSVSVNSTHEMTVSVGDFHIEVENIDGFVNLRSVRVSAEGFQQLRKQSVHGLLGQTWQSRRYGGSVKEIEGEVDDYVITDESLSGSHFSFSRFAESA